MLLEVDLIDHPEINARIQCQFMEFFYIGPEPLGQPWLRIPVFPATQSSRTQPPIPA